jgi:hypothetical protein
MPRSFSPVSFGSAIRFERSKHDTITPLSYATEKAMLLINTSDFGTLMRREEGAEDMNYPAEAVGAGIGKLALDHTCASGRQT